AGYNFSGGITMNSVRAPSLCTPRVWLHLQGFGRPLRHDAHLPQLVYGKIATSVPRESLPSPPSPCTTVADTSCPGIRGKVTSGFTPRKEFKSLPQRPTIRIFSKMSLPPPTGSGIVSIDPCPGL